MQGKSTKNPAYQSHCARFTLSLLGFSESAPKPAAEATVRCMEMSGTRTFEVCHKEKDTKMGHLDPTRRPPFHFFAFLHIPPTFFPPFPQKNPSPPRHFLRQGNPTAFAPVLALATHQQFSLEGATIDMVCGSKSCMDILGGVFGGY